MTARYTTFPVDGGDPVFVNDSGSANTTAFGEGLVNTPAGGVTGTWASTEADDVFLGASAPAGVWGSTEVADALAGTGHPSLFGSWASTEADDVFASAGHPPAPEPNFVGAGTLVTHNFVTSTSVPYDAAEVNGDFYLCYVSLFSSGRTLSTPAGWTLLQAFNTSNHNGALYYRFGDGTGTDPTFSWTGGGTNSAAKMFHYHGVVTIGAINWTQEGANTNQFSNTGVTTTADNSLVILLWNGTGSDTVSGTPTGFTQDTSEAALAMYEIGEATIGGTPSVTNQSTTGLDRQQSFMIELTSVIPPNFAAMAVNEAKDVFAGVGGLLGGSWHSTEAADLMAAAGFVPAFATFAATEHADIMDFEVFMPPRGVWASTEAADAFAAAGSPTAPLGLDVHATGGQGNVNIDSYTSATVDITTNFNHDVIVLGIFTGGFWVQGKVSTITDTAGLTWKRRSTRQVPANHLGGTTDSYFEVWWAHKPTPGHTTITVNVDQPTGAIAIDAFAIVGANYNTPFDTNTGSGWLTDNFQGAILAGPFNHFGNPNAFVYTDVPKVFSLCFHASTDVQADTSVPPGLTFESRVAFAEHNGNTYNLASAYRTFNTQQFGTVDTWMGPDGTHISNRVLWLDNIVAADETGTDDVIRWFFDGPGNRTIEQFGVGQNTTNCNFATFREDTIGIAAVLIQSSTGTRVQSIVDTNGSSPGWQRRSVVTDTSGAISLEIWWVKLLEPLGQNGQIQITTDANTTAGDTVSCIVFGLNGPDAFNRGEIFDSNGSLPAHNRGNQTSGHQTVGPFNSSNDNVFVMAIGANIDATTNDTELDNRNNLPYLFLPAPAELQSDGPPSYHIAMQYKFNASVINGATAEFDISPAPNAWFMIADVLPVGPVSPPHGSLIVTEFKDTTHNEGSFGAIGLDDNGWVGYVPAHAGMDLHEPIDFTSNSGDYTALWAMNEGWVGWIPAFAEMAAPENDDILASHGWILGPTTILARMAANDSPDRFGFSGLFSDYENGNYSHGDRTGHITVTTNAVLNNGTVDNLVDGVKSTNNSTDAITVADSQPAAMWFKFDMGQPILINEATWYQNGNFAQPGLWVWEASNDDLTYTIISAAPFVLDAGSVGHPCGDISTNQTHWRYYQLRQTTNAGGADIPWLREIEFKVEAVTGTFGATESKDRWAGNALVIPTATPHPARKRRMLIVS